MPPITPPRTPAGRIRERKKKLKRKIAQAVKKAVTGYITGGTSGAVGAVADTVMTDVNSPSKRSKTFKSKVPKKVKGKRKYGRRYRKKRKHPSYMQIEKKGISVRFEKRKTLAGGDAEAVLIGHTSMPSKLSALNMWRAIIKFLMVRADLHLKDYGNIMVNEGFVAGDIIRVNFYAQGTVNAVSQFSITIDASDTYDKVAFRFAKAFDDTDLRVTERLDSIEIIPYAGTAFANASRIAACNVELNTLKITVSTKSLLKIQNTTVEKVGESEADDVDRVPLTGKLFQVKGNNIMRKSNGRIASGFFDLNNDEAVMEKWSKQHATTTENLEYYADSGAANNNQTVFSKPAEVPKRWEFTNCESEAYVTVQPGSIHSSVLNSTLTVGLNWFYRFVYGTGSTKEDKINYDPKLGHTKFFYLEKMVGRKPLAGNVNQINLWVELEVNQKALVHGPYGEYCTPIQYQIDYDA